MNLCAVEGTPLVRAQPMGQSLCETWVHYVPSTTTNVTTYPLLSSATNITRYVWGLDISGQSGGRASSQAEMQGAGGVGGLCAVFSPLLKGGGGGAAGGLPDGITPHYPACDTDAKPFDVKGTWNGTVKVKCACDESSATQKARKR